MNPKLSLITLHNTLSRSIEEFKPIKPGVVTMYHCGPTVYWTQHIGNLRGMTMGDLVVRTLRYFGYQVTHVRNYTDVGHLTSDSDTGEDKMEKGAKREGLDPKQIADKYIAQFERDTKALNLLEPTHKPRATEYIQQMIQLAQELMDKGFAYTTDLAVYFDVQKFPSYTKLSGQNLKQLISGAGSADVTDPAKRSPLDFALWFFKAGVHAKALQTWPSPFSSPLVKNGQGFPGWHIECSAMSRSLLGETIDIHMGGIEHIPVHHTNEIAQSEAASGKKFVDYWLHNEHLVVNNEKMAKSQGTGFSLQEIIDKGYDPLTLRYFFLGAHYRSKQNFTWEALDAAKNGLAELRKRYAELKQNGKRIEAISNPALTLKGKFENALASDFNLPQALAIAWETAKSNIEPGEKYSLLKEFDTVLGLDLDAFEGNDEKVENAPASVQTLLEKREAARKAKQFQESDALRREIESLGYMIEDAANGPKLRRKSR